MFITGSGKNAPLADNFHDMENCGGGSTVTVLLLKNDVFA